MNSANRSQPLFDLLVWRCFIHLGGWVPLAPDFAVLP